ncbi:MAG: B12-binding domain-containing radical SAM protein [Candidatus Marinimicrobia bacterium]|nr:B12-binding domain-containing radical SAM protein [Candidatus Neomarinimicrobiota bacterium]
MKICLIQPPIDDFYATEIRNIPLGLLSIGAQIKDHEVSILDMRYSKSRGIKYPEAFSVLKQYYRQDDRSPLGLYKNFYRFGCRPEEFENVIPQHIEVFGISANFTTYSDNVLEILRFLKISRPDSKIVIGGHACAALPGNFLENGADFEVYGEGEETFPKLIEAISASLTDFSSIPNLIWKKDEEMVINPQKMIKALDALKFADYSLPGTPSYQLGRKKHAMLMISRGCPYKCSFCSIHQVMGYQYRTRSVTNVIAEIEQKIHQGFRSFDFEDDHFGGQKKWLNEFLDQIIDKFSKFDLSFQAMNGITATNLNEELLVKMKSVGFSSLNLALVSENEQEQNHLHRPFSTHKFTELVHLAEKHGFFITAYIILGLPEHTINQMLNSILFLAELPVLIGPSFFYLVPNTPIFNQLQKNNLIPKDTSLYRSSFMPYETENFKRKDLMTLFRITRIINFIKELRSQAIDPKFQINNHDLVLKEGLSGNEIRLQLGLALLQLFNQSGKIFGLKKTGKNLYKIRPESVSQDIVNRALEKIPLMDIK